MTLYYLGYGSNLHPLRLRERVPSAVLVGTTIVEGCDLRFHKRGMDSSGKCDLYFTGDPDTQVRAAVYAMEAGHKPDLDRFEGPGYDTRELSVEVAGHPLRCFTYVALESYIDPSLQPYDWYLQIVAAGALWHDFPASYLTSITAVAAVNDPDSGRRQHHQDLLQRMMHYGA